MATHTHRRQVPLFLLAILLPSAVLVALGVRMIGQESELAEKRLGDERSRVTGQVRQAVASRLERIALQEAAVLATDPSRALLRDHEDPAVVLVARIAEGRLVLPWERDPRTQEARELMAEGEFALLVARGEYQELVTGETAAAAASYGQAAEVARHPLQDAYAHLLLARAAGRGGGLRGALEHHRLVVNSPPGLLDEHGIPLCLYSAVRLLELAEDDGAVRACLEREVRDPRWLSPPALHLMADLADAVEGSKLSAIVHGYLRRTEQALALQQDFGGLRLALPLGMEDLTPARRGAQGVAEGWVLYGSPAWLVGLAPPVGAQPAVVVAVRAREFLSSLPRATIPSGEIAGVVALAGDDASPGESLGPAFPGLEVRFPPEQRSAYDRQWDVQRRFYLITLALVIGATLLSAYLLWRDVRRELRLAQMRSEFVATVSHELKTPLAAIRMFAETLQMGRPADPEAKAEYLDTIVNESERLSRLLSNVLDFSKIEEGTKTYRRQPESLPEIVRSAVRAMRYPAEQHRFRLNVELEEGMPPVTVDRDSIEQAILNLLANAMKYSGVNRDIDLRLRQEDGEAVVEVSDRGPGIEPGERERIFHRFYRVPTQENQRIPGTGLGLTLVRHIVEAHGGKVTLESAPGLGSTFRIHLPLEETEA